MDLIDNICYLFKNIRNRFITFKNGLKKWLSYYKVCQDLYDFDWSSILLVEKHQIQRVRDAIQYYHNHVNWERDVKHMNTALKLLDIVLENGCAEYTGPQIDWSADKITIPNSWYLPVYVNTKNGNRFIKYSENFLKHSSEIYKDQLRQAKAWHLYNKMREYFLFQWWD